MTVEKPAAAVTQLKMPYLGDGAGEAEAEPDEGAEGSVIPMDGRRASGG